MEAFREIVGLLWCIATVGLQGASYDELSLLELDERLYDIDEELSELASLSLRSGFGTIGYRSSPHQEAAKEEWIEVDLGNPQLIDEIVLAPTIWRDTQSGFLADGFPLEFKVIAGKERGSAGTVVASFDSSDNLLPRVAPLVIPCQGVTASWIRIEANVLTTRAWDGLYILQLSQILVFSESRNIALHRPVTASEPKWNEGPARDKSFLVNGFVPYLMDAAHGERSLAFVSLLETEEKPEMLIDLGESYSLDCIHLHATELSDTAPRTSESDFGVPYHLLIEGANRSDFSDAKTLVDYKRSTVYEMSPIIVRNFSPVRCRYVRLRAPEPYIPQRDKNSAWQIGFAEIECFSGKENVALGKSISGNLKGSSAVRLMSSLTDGRNLYGEILPFRKWMVELARRHELEIERPLIVEVKNRRHARQRVILTRMGWLVALLIAGIVFTILLNHNFRLRHVARIRERLAADLHDELGANLHTIGLLSDLAAEAGGDPDELATLHRRIRSETERSGTAVRHCTDMLEAPGLSSDFEEDMKRASRRIMSKLKHEITIEGAEHLNSLNPRIRHDLFLFYKECLVNISRHAGASQYTTFLKLDERRVELIISDNGRGISGSTSSGIPASIKRRAKLLGGKLEVESSASGGTRVVLKLRTKKWSLVRN